MSWWRKVSEENRDYRIKITLPEMSISEAIDISGRVKSLILRIADRPGFEVALEERREEEL
jgi:hypothetical protein